MIGVNINIDTMTMWVPDLTSHDGPRYRAIADAIGAAICGGDLNAGDRLPPQRELAWKLGVTVGTVSRGYTLAEQRGLLSGEIGRGTYVRSSGSQTVQGQTLTVDHGGVYDLSVNSASLAGRDAMLAETLRDIANDADLEGLLRYMPTVGHPRHRGAIAAWLQRYGVDHASADLLTLAAGAEQGIMTSVAVLTRTGEPIMTETLTYPGIIEAAHVLDRPIIGLMVDEQGALPDALERAAVDRKARVAVLVPTIQNPTAVVMPEQRRREIAAVAQRRDLLIIEDDVYGKLPEHRSVTIATLAPERTIYLGSASKCLAPGLRAGWMLAPERFLSRLANSIYATSVAQPALTFEIVLRWIENGTADRLVKDLRHEMTARQKIARDILDDFDFDTHENAFHIWLKLPGRWRGGTFSDAAAARNIRIMSGSGFMTGDGPTPRAVRISISRPPDQETLARDLNTLRDILIAGPTAGRTMV